MGTYHGPAGWQKTGASSIAPRPSSQDIDVEADIIADDIDIGDDDTLDFGDDEDYQLSYNATNTRFELITSDAGGGASGGVFQVQDGTDDIGFLGGLAVGGANAPTSGITIPNDDFYKGRNDADDADLDLLSANTRDNARFGVSPELPNDTFLVGENNAGDGTISAVKVNTSDEVEAGATVDLGAGNDLRVQDGQSVIDASDNAHITVNNNGNTDMERTVNFPNITGTPTMAGHDHAEGGMTTVPNSGLVNDTITVSGSDGLGGGSAALGNSLTIGITGDLDLNSDLLAADGEVIWDESNTYIPQGRLQNDSVTVSSGDGLKNGGSVSLGNSITLNIEPNDFAGSFLSDDGTDDLQVDIGNGLEGDGGGNIRVRGDQVAGNALTEGGSPYEVDVASGGIQTDELDLSISPTWSDNHTFHGNGSQGESIAVGRHIFFDGDGTTGPVIRIDGGSATDLRLYDGNARLFIDKGGDYRVGNGDGTGDIMEWRDGDAESGAIRAQMDESGNLSMEGTITEGAAL